MQPSQTIFMEFSNRDEAEAEYEEIVEMGLAERVVLAKIVRTHGKG